MNDSPIMTRVEWHTHRDSLLAVRYAVFVEEQGIPEAIETDEGDPVAIHRLALDSDENPIGTARLLPDGRIGRVAVLRTHRRKGIGSKLVSALTEDARGMNLGEVTLHAQVSSLKFYEQLGFNGRGKVFDEVGIPHLEMVFPL